MFGVFKCPARFENAQITNADCYVDDGGLDWWVTGWVRCSNCGDMNCGFL